MKNKRARFIVFSFVLLTIFVMALSFNIQINVDNDVSYLEVEKIETTSFGNAYYYSLKNELPHLYLLADLINIRGNSAIEFLAPEGVLYNKEEKINFKAKKGNYNSKKLILSLYEDVGISNLFSTYKADEIFYTKNKGIIRAEGSVKTQFRDEKTHDLLVVKSDKMDGYEKQKKIIFKGNVEGSLKRLRKYEVGYDFKAQNVEYLGEDSLLKLTKDVGILYKNYEINSARSDVFLENYNKRLKYYVMYDDIELEEKISQKNRPEVRKAYAERLEGIVSEGKIVLSGSPRLIQGKDILKGYQITLRENTEIVEIDDSQSSFRFKEKE